MENNTKLSINLKEGLIQVEGTQDFVRSVYDDFKEYMRQAKSSGAGNAVIPLAGSANMIENTPPNGSTRSKKPERQDREKSKSGEYKPNYNSSLDLKDLEETYVAFDPKSNNEKILLFAIFLRDHLNIAPCTMDDVYTCFKAMKGKTATPEAFVQAFRTAEHRTHYIEMDAEKVKITIAGDNYYNKSLNQKKTAK